MPTNWSNIIQNYPSLTMPTGKKSCFYPLTQLGLLAVVGENAQTFLQGQLTCDLNQVTFDRCSPGGICDAKGRLQTNVIVFVHAEHYFLLMAKSMVPLMLKHLQKYAVFSKVTMTDETPDWYIAGMQLQEPTELDKSILRLPVPSQSKRFFLLSRDTNQLKAWWQTQSEMIIGDDNAWELLNIQNGLATIVPATKGLFTPQMINLEKLNGVSFKKGCYIGQEIVARTQHLGKLKRHLYQIQFISPTRIEIGASISTQDQQSVGDLINIAHESENTYRGLAVIEDRAINQALFLNEQRITIIA